MDDVERNAASAGQGLYMASLSRADVVALNAIARELADGSEAAGLVIDVLDQDGKVRCSRCRLLVTLYSATANLSIEAVCTGESVNEAGEPMEPGEHWGALTANPPGTKIQDGMVCVKDYSKGAGNLRTLSEAGLVEMPPVTMVRSGSVELPVCKLTKKAVEWIVQTIAIGREVGDD